MEWRHDVLRRVRGASVLRPQRRANHIELVASRFCRPFFLAPVSADRAGILVCLVVTAFVLTPILWWRDNPPRTPFFSLEPSSFGYIWHNLLRPRAQVAIGHFPNGGPYPGDWNGSLWTLFYECACYLMIGGLGLVGLLRPARAWGLGLLLCLLVMHSFSTGLLTRFPTTLLRLFDTPGKHLTVYFFAGSVWALLPQADTMLVRHRWVGPAASVLLIASWHGQFHAWLAVWLMPIVLFWLARVLPFTSFEQRMRGDYSYGIYIYGFPLQQVLAHFGVHTLGFGLFLLASYLGAGTLAWASWHAVERPALALKHLFRKPSTHRAGGGGAPSPLTEKSPAARI